MASIIEAIALEALGEYAQAERMLRASLADSLGRNDALELGSARLRLRLLQLLADQCRPGNLAEVTELANQLIEMKIMEITDGDGNEALARILMAQGRLPEAEAAAEKALSVLQTQRTSRPRVYRTLIEIRLRQGRAADALCVVEEVRQYLNTYGSAGRADIQMQVAVAEAYVAAGDLVSAQASLRETLRLIEQCAQRIPDPGMRERYRNEVRENARAKELARMVQRLCLPSQQYLD